MLCYTDAVLTASVDSHYTATSINVDVLNEMCEEEKTKKILQNSNEKSNSSSKLLEKTMSEFRKDYM